MNISHSSQEFWFWTEGLCVTGSLEASQVYSAWQTSDQHMALEIYLSSSRTHLHWVHSEVQLADVMTMSSGAGRNMFEEFMKRNRWRITF